MIIREQKIKNIVNEIPDLPVDGEQEGELLVVGWGGTYGAITEAVMKYTAAGDTKYHRRI